MLSSWKYSIGTNDCVHNWPSNTQRKHNWGKKSFMIRDCCLFQHFRPLQVFPTPSCSLSQDLGTMSSRYLVSPANCCLPLPLSALLASGLSSVSHSLTFVSVLQWKIENKSNMMKHRSLNCPYSTNIYRRGGSRTTSLACFRDHILLQSL